MKKLTFLALSLVAAGAAFADDPTVVNDHATYDKTRAQVQTELQQARADGSIRNWSISYNQFAKFQGTQSRADVKAEAIAARAQSAALNGEDSGSFALSRQPKSRDAGPLFAGTPRNAQ